MLLQNSNKIICSVRIVVCLGSANEVGIANSNYKPQKLATLGEHNKTYDDRAITAVT